MRTLWIVALALCMAQLGHCGPRWQAKMCTSARDCKKGECCAAESQRRGKRQSGNHTGMCIKFGTANSACMVTPYQTAGGVYENYCPCSRGHICEGTGLITVPQGEQGICVLTPTHCNTSAECNFRTECCVSNTRPIGKRSVFGPSTGRCLPMGGRGDDCLERNGSGWDRNDLVYEHCPCQAGLRCVPDGRVDIPLGKVGTCRRGKYGLFRWSRK